MDREQEIINNVHPNRLLESVLPGLAASTWRGDENSGSVLNIADYNGSESLHAKQLVKMGQIHRRQLVEFSQST